MSDLSQHSFTKLKWLVRYLKREAVEPRVRIREHEFRGLVGRHILKYTSKHAIIARSSALGASEAKGIESMMRDLGFAVEPVLVLDAKATEHILHRHGIGRMKHIYVAHLWLQDEDKSNRLKARRVKSEDKLEALSNKIISNTCDIHGVR